MTGLADKARRNLGLLIMALVTLLFPFVVSNPYYLNVVNIIGLNTIIVVGLNLLIGYAGQISLGHAAFYGLGAYISGILTVTYGISPWLAIGAALLVTCCTALFIGMPTLKLHGHYLVMATLGFNLIVNIILIQWDAVTGGPSGFPGIPNLAIGSWLIDSDRKMFYLIWFLAFLSIVVSLNLVDSRVGRGLRALHGSEIAAASLGIHTERYKIKVFVLSALFAALAGCLYAHYLTFVSPKTFDIFFSIELVTMVIVGGMGSIWGGLFGAVIMTPLPSILHFFDEYKDIFHGLILVLMLVYLPEGIVVALHRQWFALTGAERGERRTSTGSEEASHGKKQFPVAEDLSPARFAGSSGAARGSILRVEGVSMGFGGILALGNVSFQIPGGSVTALIGPNGAGKTTMINVISGVYRPARGRVGYLDKDITGKPSHALAAMGLTRTFQNLQVFENMTVLENVMVGLHARTSNEFLRSMFRLPGFESEEKQIARRAWEVLDFLGLEDKGHWPASSLSFGDQKRIEIARALAAAPRLVLLDEPAAGLNMTETKEIARIIDEIRAQGVSVLLVEHDMNLVMGISDRVVVLDYGVKVADGTPAEVQRDEKVLSAYLGSE